MRITFGGIPVPVSEDRSSSLNRYVVVIVAWRRDMTTVFEIN